MNIVTINGRNSDEVRLKFDKLPLWAHPAQRYNTYKVVGRGEDLTQATGDFDDIKLDLTAYLVGKTTINDVYQWLLEEGQIVLSTQPDVYGIIRQVGEIRPERDGWNAHKIDIPLICSPFRYNIKNDPVILSENPAYLRTKGNYFSEPIIALTGTSGNIEIAVNGATLQIEDAPNNVYIDVQNRVIYTAENDTKRAITHTTTGEFWSMVLVPDKEKYNEISWSGTVGTVSIIKNERWL